MSEFICTYMLIGALFTGFAVVVTAWERAKRGTKRITFMDAVTGIAMLFAWPIFISVMVVLWIVWLVFYIRRFIVIFQGVRAVARIRRRLSELERARKNVRP